MWIPRHPFGSRAVWTPLPAAEYQALGPILESDLFAPEFQITTSPTIIGYLNGVTSLARFGLTSCEQGFGTDKRAQPHMGKDRHRYCGEPSRSTVYPAQDGQSLVATVQKGAYDRSSSDGALGFTPRAPNKSAAEVVSELDFLLTAGRLSEVARQVIEREYVRVRDEYKYFAIKEWGTNCTHWGGELLETIEECELAARATGQPATTAASKNTAGKPVGCYVEGTSSLEWNSDGAGRIQCSSQLCLCKSRGDSHALTRAIELILTTPDFAVTNLAQPATKERKTQSQSPSGGADYKAIVVLFLEGGADSWNLLVPHSGCSPGNSSTNYQSYAYLRGGVEEGVALRYEDLHAIDVAGARLASSP